MKILFVTLVVLTSSCMRLDDNLYNLTGKISEYKFDSYQGEQDFVLGPSYNIPTDRINLVTLASRSPRESTSTTIYGVYIGDIARVSTDTVIMYCHGNKWHMDFYWQRAKLLAHTGGKNRYGVMMVDYRGFGLSEGQPSEEGMYADVDAALEWLKSNGLNGTRLIMYGFSLGSAAACELTAHPRALPPSRLILESPFASAAVMVQDAAQLAMPASFVTNLELNNAKKVETISQPFMWMHGQADMFLNYKTHGQVVFDHYHGAYKEKHLVPGADHGEVPEKFGFENYVTTLERFIHR